MRLPAILKEGSAVSGFLKLILWVLKMAGEYFSLQDLENLTLPEEDILPDKGIGEQPPRVNQKPVYQLASSVLNPELKQKLESVLALLAEKGMTMPVVHVTSAAVKAQEGKEIPTEFVSNILRKGFEGSRNTNVGGFVVRLKGKAVLGTSQDFMGDPLEFIRDLYDVLEYLKHGLRTNKPRLGTLKNEGEGVPVMLIVDATDLSLIQGSDRQSHWQFKEPVKADRIIGKVDLFRNNSPINRGHAADLEWVANEFLDRITNYISKKYAT